MGKNKKSEHNTSSKLRTLLKKVFISLSLAEDPNENSKFVPDKNKTQKDYDVFIVEDRDYFAAFGSKISEDRKNFDWVKGFSRKNLHATVRKLGSA